MHAASDIVLGVVLAPAAAATALQGSVAQAPGTLPGSSGPAGAAATPVPATAGADSGNVTGVPVATVAPEGLAAAATAAPASTPFVPAPVHHAASTQAGAPPAFGKPAPSAAGAVGGTVFALLFVVGLILALAWLARRMPGVAGGSHRALRVVASLSLGPRDKVVVVDVGGQQLLLGVGAGGTRALHTLAAPLPEPERTATPAFAQLLAQHFGKKA